MFALFIARADHESLYRVTCLYVYGPTLVAETNSTQNAT